MVLGAALAAVLAGLAGFAARAQQPASPPGDPKSPKTRVLEAGAKVLQRNSPPGAMNEDFAQCALFDGTGRDARLNGIEYIISEKLFESLPQEERQYWHPHNAEILSGQLVAPDIPAAAEKALMKLKMNSHGKTWHLWNTGSVGQAADALPLGPAMLAWSFNRDGEARPGLVEERDRKLGVNTAENGASARTCNRWRGRSPVSMTCVRRFRKARTSPGCRQEGRRGGAGALAVTCRST